MNLFKNKVKKDRIDQSTRQVLDLEVQKKRLELERDQVQLDLDNVKRRQEMALEEERHKHRLALETEKANFDRERQIWEKDKAEMLAKFKEKQKDYEERLKAEHELKTQEAVTLTKLESQQKIKQTELDKERAISALETKHAEALAKVKSESAEQHYNKLKDALEELHQNGDKNSRFVQELALKAFERVPVSRTAVDVEVSTPRLVDKTDDSVTV